jgi:hypothetical protein
MTFLPLDRTCFRLDLDLFVTTKHTSSRRLIASDLFAVTFAFFVKARYSYRCYSGLRWITDLISLHRFNSLACEHAAAAVFDCCHIGGADYGFACW